MTACTHPASIHLWTGDFASQQLTFAHLLDVADTLEAPIDFDNVEVVPRTQVKTRLGAYFSAIPDLDAGPMIVVLPVQEGAPCPFEHTEHLRYLGCHPGQVIRAPGLWV